MNTLWKFRINTNEILLLLIVSINILCYINYGIYQPYYNVASIINLALYIVLLATSVSRKLEITDFFILFFATSYALVTSAFNGNSSGAIVAYIELFLTIEILSNKCLSNSGWKIITLCSILVVLRYIFSIPHYYTSWLGNMEGMLNPNTVSFFLYFTFVITSYWLSTKNRFNKKLIFLIWVFTAICITKLNCRTYMFSTLVVGILLLFASHNLLNSKKIVIIILITLFIGGIIFPYIYVALSKNIQLSILVHKYTHKYLFTGREFTWQRFFEYELNHKTQFLFGVGSHAERSFSTTYSLHNSYLGIIMNFGIVGYIIYMICNVYYICKIFRYCEHISSPQYVLLIGYIGFLVASFSEVVLQTPMSALLVGICYAGVNKTIEEINSENLVDKNGVE